MNNKSDFLKSVGLLTIVAIISKVIGFGRELLMAAYYGTSDVSDAFFVASIVPVLLFTAVGMAINTGLSPLYAKAKREDPNQAGEIISVLSTGFLVIAIIITIISMIFTPEITKLMAPGFSVSQQELTNNLTLIMLPSFVFLVLAAVSTGILEYEKRFLIPGMVAIPQNLLIILAILFFTNVYGVYGLAVATLLGAIAQFAIQYPFVRKYKVTRINFNFKKYKLDIIKTIYLFYPIIIASVAYQFNAVVDRIIASGLEKGSVSALNYSNKLMFLPLSIVLLSLITVLFPSVVDAAIEKGAQFGRIVLNGLIMLFFVSIPITVVMLVESTTLIEIAYQRGKFDYNSVSLTASAFYFYTFGMAFIALKEYLNRCFVATQSTKITMWGSVTSILLNIVLSIILSKYLGVGGIALATSIAMLYQTLFLFVFVLKMWDISKENIIKFFKSFLKLVVLFLLLYVGSYYFSSYITIMNNFIHLVITTIIVIVLFLILSILLKVEELQPIMRVLFKKIKSEGNS